MQLSAGLKEEFSRLSDKKEIVQLELKAEISETRKLSIHGYLPAIMGLDALLQHHQQLIENNLAFKLSFF